MTSVSEPPWLNETEMRAWRSFLEVSDRVANAISDGLKTNSELTADDYDVLVHLSEADDERLRMTELSQRLVHSQSRLTQRIDRLAKKGFVCREKCSNDRRSTFACLTPAGRSALEAAAPHHVVDVRAALIDRLSPAEHAQLATIFERIVAEMRSEIG